MSKEYKGWDLLKEIAEGKIKEGTKFRDNYHIYTLRKDGIGAEIILVDETNGTPDYSYFADNDNTFEIIEEEPEIGIQGLEELNIIHDIRPFSKFDSRCLDRNFETIIEQQNKILKAVKQLDNQINNK